MGALSVLQVTPFYRPHVGGMENYTASLSAALAVRGHEIHVLTTNTENAAPEEREGAFTVRRADVNARFHNGVLSMHLYREMKATKADIVHLHAPFPLGLEMAHRARRGKPLVVTYHGEGVASRRLTYRLPRTLYSRWEKWMLRAADRLVLLTESYRDSMPLKEGLLARTKVIETGVDVRRFHPATSGEPSPYGAGFHVLFVGSLVAANRYKGVDVLLEAASLLPPDVRLHVVGRGALVDEYRARARSLGIASRVEFHTGVGPEDLPVYYRHARLFVLPSVHGPENAPLVMLEAMASGVPVLGTRIPGVTGMLRDGKLGALVPPRDARALAEAIAHASAHPEPWKARAADARRHVEREHDWNVVACRYEQTYREVLSGSPRAP